MDSISEKFLSLVRYAIRADETIPLLEPKEWHHINVMSQKQAITGVVFCGIERLKNDDVTIPREIIYNWIGDAEQIKLRNHLVNQRCVELTELLRKDGFECCVLKGQGNAMLYPKPLLRTPGDIDIWVRSKLKIENGKLIIKEIVHYVKGKNPEGRALYHHIDLGEYKGVEVEVHYRPSFMFNPMHNRRLQKWFISHTNNTEIKELPDGVGNIRVPNEEFNIIFQLSHVYNHLLHEGIGLRQIIDYYYLLRNAENKLKKKNEELRNMLKYLGLEKIAGAMMWMLNEMLGLSEEYLIAPKDEIRGRVLLAEIMKAGNFGYYDIKNQKANSSIKKNFQRIKRDMRMVRYFPSECLWEPVFRIYHYCWRLAN